MLNKVIRYTGVILPFLYKYLFDKLYIDVISVRYSYFGTYLDFNSTKNTISWIMLILITVLLLLLKEGKLKSFYRLMLYFSIVPSLSLYGLKNENSTAFALIVLYWLIMWLAIFFLQRVGKEAHIEGGGSFIPDCEKIYIWFLFFFVLLSTLYLWVRYGGFRFFIGFADVYSYRKLDVSMSSIERYVLLWNTNLFIPVCIYIFFMQKKYVRFGITFLLMDLSYAMFGNKMMFFLAFSVVGICILCRWGLEKLADELIGIFMLLYQLLCMLIPKGFIAGVEHRLLIVPSEAHYYYYDFFQDHELLFLRQSFLRHFLPDPYDQPVSMLIGSSTKYYYTAKPDDFGNVNNGLFSDAYQNFGVLGVIIFPIIIVIILNILFRALRRYDQGLQFVILLISALFLLSSYCFSWLLSGGVILILIALRYIKKHNKRNKVVRIRLGRKSKL